MLDFYLIDDQISTPSAPEDGALELAGSLSLELFQRLGRKGYVVENGHADFRWSSVVLEQKLKMISNSQDTDLRKFSEILQKASNLNSGLIAYCD